MGEHGEITRVIGVIVGSAFTYAPLSLHQSTAPNQLTADTLLNVYHFKKLNRNTMVSALLGDPVDKSFGYLCHNAVFYSQNINAVNTRIRVTEDEFPEFWKLIQSLPFQVISHI